MQRFSLLARRPPSDAQLTGSSSLKLRIPISKVFVCICNASIHSGQNGFARLSKLNLDVEPGQRKSGGQPNERDGRKVYSDPSLTFAPFVAEPSECWLPMAARGCRRRCHHNALS